MTDLISCSKCTISKCCTYFDSSLCSCSLPWWYSWNTKSSFLFDTALYRKFGWFFGFSMKNFFTTLSSFLLILAKALSQFSLLYHISEVFRNVSSYLFDNHFRCQKIIYIIFYALCTTMNYDEGWGWGLLVLLYCLSSVVANESTFLQWLSAFSVFWNAFFHMFLSLLYCLLVNSLFC